MAECKCLSRDTRRNVLYALDHTISDFKESIQQREKEIRDINQGTAIVPPQSDNEIEIDFREKMIAGGHRSIKELEQTRSIIMMVQICES